jgi:hypothetical protein
MRYLIEAALMIIFAMFMVVVLIEWAAGCGETYIDANGVRHAYECVFIK